MYQAKNFEHKLKGEKVRRGWIDAATPRRLDAGLTVLAMVLPLPMILAGDLRPPPLPWLPEWAEWPILVAPLILHGLAERALRRSPRRPALGDGVPLALALGLHLAAGAEFVNPSELRSTSLAEPWLVSWPGWQAAAMAPWRHLRAQARTA